MRVFRRIPMIGAALLLLGTVAGAAHAQRQASAARIDTTVAFVATGNIDVNVPAGDITVTGWDRNEVRVRATSALGDVRVDVSGNRLSVGAGAFRRRLGETSIELEVPRGANVTIVSHAGEMAVRGLRGTVTANSTNGDIEVADLGGTAALTTVMGDVRGERLGGSIKAAATNGNVVLREVDGAIAASTTNGRVTLTAIRSRSVRAGSVNGQVEYEGPFDRAGSYELQAHNGNIVLYISDGTNATLRLATYSGHVESDIPLTLAEGTLRGQQQYTFSLGEGGATISAQSYTGNIFIRRAPRPNR